MKTKADPYFYPAELDRVIDGDTITCTLDLGFKIHYQTKIRFYGVNSAESRTRNKREKEAGLRAKARLIELLDGADLHIQSFGVGKYGRVLGILYDGRKNLFDTLLKEGHLRPYDGGKREPWF